MHHRPNKSPEPTAVVATDLPGKFALAVAVSPPWLSFLR